MKKQNENLTEQDGNLDQPNVIKSLPTVEELDKKWFYPTDKVKDEAARVGAKWLRHFLLGEVEQ